MDEFSASQFPDWIKTKMLAFFNRAQSPSNLIENISSIPAHAIEINETLARRIIEERETQPLKSFSRFAELQGIEGLEEGVLNKLADYLHVPADDIFRNALFEKEVLLPNFFFQSHSVIVEEEEFERVAKTKNLLLTRVQQLVREACLLRESRAEPCEGAANSLNSLYLESFSSSLIASHAFALWFFRFDEDNFFSFDAMQKEIALYLNSYRELPGGLEFCLFKGFRNEGVLADAITVQDLPVVINHPEKRISIWWAQLKD